MRRTASVPPQAVADNPDLAVVGRRQPHVAVLWLVRRLSCSAVSSTAHAQRKSTLASSCCFRCRRGCAGGSPRPCGHRCARTASCETRLFVDTAYKFVVALMVLILVLLIRPHGILGAGAVRMSWSTHRPRLQTASGSSAVLRPRGAGLNLLLLHRLSTRPRRVPAGRATACHLADQVGRSGSGSRSASGRGGARAVLGIPPAPPGDYFHRHISAPRSSALATPASNRHRRARGIVGLAPARFLRRTFRRVLQHR